ncbi:MAG: type IV secretory system conjugative DNA transfer family protein [Clostridiales bacterium]|jgi:type IV secretion system protein VirD4|nr:type IV secretory system conjugative DNA transfer family protein [Clostridiales bacterium]
MSLKKKIPLYFFLILLAVTLLGGFLRSAYLHVDELMGGGDYSVLLDLSVLAERESYMAGAAAIASVVVLWLAFAKPSSKRAKKLMAGKAKEIAGALENSRFMDTKEFDFNFAAIRYAKLAASKKDGIAVRALYNPRKRDMDVNIAPPMHGLIIGATGSGKTTTFINPVIQILGATSAGSSIICTDPKGELFQTHSKFLESRGYHCMVLDLREPYSSFRWNPLEDMYQRYQTYIHYGDDIFKRTGPVPDSGIELADPREKYGSEWYEFGGKAYADAKKLMDFIRVNRQRAYDEVYEDLNDLIGVICPIESQDDPVWEKGARSIIMAVALAMLEDCETPELGMAREKYCFYNINKAVGNSENEFAALKDYFKGRPALSKAANMSKQVLSSADNTLQSYMSIAYDKLAMFNDEGICSLTSATDIDPTVFADRPTALFLKIPDEKDTRHALAGVFVLSMYKALIKIASQREDLSLPRNVYFLLDEFGNMPKIDKFDKMITVGRSRKIWFQMVVQSYAQLNNVYGDKVADIIKSNCGIKLFIGSNDIDTCKEFSELCGNMTVSTNSVSSALNDKSGDYNVSSQLQTRPLIYPSELQRLNNKKDSGNAILVTFGNYPAKTKYTPSYQCPLYRTGCMDISSLGFNAFYGEEVFYDLYARNNLVLGGGEDGQKSESDGGGAGGISDSGAAVPAGVGAREAVAG